MRKITESTLVSADGSGRSTCARCWLPRRPRPGMTAGGRIITIGSALDDRVPVPGITLYAMAKSARTGMTRGLARDLGPRGITVTLVHGGLIDTEMNPADSPAASFLSSIPALAPFGSADDIATIVTHLAGEGGRYATGTAISVDGGFAA